ncbi:mRNA export factor Gle1 isoform X2 [Malaya genurostris]|uniref:mRNA export factor Gle1 isoform X2 n=1 Tax=Malaya genurostris TaxID=325434 RepID=UPI0026F3F2CE|nr:mRNA export factor Gle1 isoform X2 [Malaya genurostris]
MKMARFSFDIDDLLADVQSLKLSALSHAASISPLVKGRTIGPDCNDNDELENDCNLSNGSAKKLPFVPELKVTVINRPDKSGGCLAPPRRVDISDCRAISFKMYEQEQERHRVETVKKELQLRNARIQEADRLRDIGLEEKLRMIKEKAAKKALEDERKLLAEIREHELKAKEFEELQKAKIDEENQRLAKISHQLKMKEEEIKRKNAMFDAIREQQANFRKMTEVFTKALISIDKEFSARFTNQKKSVQNVIKSFEQLLHGVYANREVSQQDIDKSIEYCKLLDQNNSEVFDIMNQIQKEIADRTKKEQEEQAQTAQKQEQQLKQVVEINAVSAAPITDTTDTTAKSIQPSQPNLAHPLAAFVSQESLAFYTEIKRFYEQHQAAVKALLDDVNMKTYRFNCQKVINTPVNAISAVSREHFVDKFTRLDALLSGQPVKIGDTSVSINGHPLGRTYCTMLLAKKFVSQADTMISSNAPAAFPIATIVVGLWQRYPDFGRFFLAYLHKECPYLVPYFLPQLERQSHEDYFKSIGYRYSADGQLEKQDQYLKRMTGLARLYSAVVVANVRRGEATPHPHSFECGWRWMCNILNLQPLPDICATLLTEFLQIAGASLWAHYGKQYTKLLQVIQGQYLPALNKVDEGGPKARLEALIAKITAEGRIERPEGMLSPDFW